MDTPNKLYPYEEPVLRYIMITSSRSLPRNPGKSIIRNAFVKYVGIRAGDTLIHGDADGRDTYAKEIFRDEFLLPDKPFLAKECLKEAGGNYKYALILRNEKMVDQHLAIIVACRTNGEMTGTTRAMEYAFKQGYVCVAYEPYYKHTELFILVK
jgi:hypothetical protein